MTEDRQRLLRIAQTASREIAAELLRVGRPASKVLMWMSVEGDDVVGMSVFGHHVLLDELARRNPAIDQLLTSPLPRSMVRVVVKDEEGGGRAAGHVVLGAAEAR